MWISLGPLPLPSDASGTGLQDYGWVTGRATAVAIDPNDPSGNTVYAGGAYGGVWKSSNGGPASPNPISVNWTALTDNQATLAIGSIAIQPQLSIPDPTKSVVLVGTGETNSSADSYYGLGILRSPDGGQSWMHHFAGLDWSAFFRRARIQSDCFQFGQSKLVVAAAASASQGILEGLENSSGSSRGLYYSTDAGQSWQAAIVNDPSASITPSSATAVTYNATAATFYAAIRFHGFYSSPDGVTWTQARVSAGKRLEHCFVSAAGGCSKFLPNLSGRDCSRSQPCRPHGMGEMYAWSVDANDGDQGIWQSLDGGASWTRSQRFRHQQLRRFLRWLRNCAGNLRSRARRGSERNCDRPLRRRGKSIQVHYHECVSHLQRHRKQ